MVLSQTCAVVVVLRENVGAKQRFFLLLVAKGRENPAVGAKNPGRWSRYAGGRLIQVILNGRLSVHEKSVAKSRWSLGRLRQVLLYLIRFALRLDVKKKKRKASPSVHNWLILLIHPTISTTVNTHGSNAPPKYRCALRKGAYLVLSLHLVVVQWSVRGFPWAAHTRLSCLMNYKKSRSTLFHCCLFVFTFQCHLRAFLMKTLILRVHLNLIASFHTQGVHVAELGCRRGPISVWGGFSARFRVVFQYFSAGGRKLSELYHEERDTNDICIVLRGGQSKLRVPMHGSRETKCGITQQKIPTFLSSCSLSRTIWKVWCVVASELWERHVWCRCQSFMYQAKCISI